MADNNTVQYNHDVNRQTRNVVRLAAITAERGYYPTGSETELRLEQQETDMTARVANDTARIAHYDAYEVN